MMAILGAWLAAISIEDRTLRWSAFAAFVVLGVGLLALEHLSDSSREKREEELHAETRRLIAERSRGLDDLHEANTRHENVFARQQEEIARLTAIAIPPRLKATQIAAIGASLRAGLDELSKNWPPDTPKGQQILVACIGRDQRTLDYRQDFADAIQAGGCRPIFEEWDATHPECTEFRGKVTVIEADARNRIRTLLVKALRDAEVDVREGGGYPLGPGRDRPNIGRATQGARLHIVSWVACLVVGQYP